MQMVRIRMIYTFYYFCHDNSCKTTRDLLDLLEGIDLKSEGKKIPFETLMAMHEKKTGALIKASCLLGAMAADITDESDARYRAAVKYAYGIGIAFQIVDDILDVEGDAALIGKATHADAALEKTTFLSFMTVAEARAYAEKLTAEAIDAIAPYEGNETLKELAKFLLYRNTVPYKVKKARLY